MESQDEKKGMKEQLEKLRKDNSAWEKREIELKEKIEEMKDERKKREDEVKVKMVKLKYKATHRR